MNLPRYAKIGFIAKRLGTDNNTLLAEFRRRRITPEIRITVKWKPGGRSVKGIERGGHYDMRKMVKYFPQLLESK